MLKSVMSRTEYMKWMAYKIHKQPDTMEVQMATLTAMVAGGLGVKNVSADDYLVNKPPKADVNNSMRSSENSDVMSGEEVQAFFGMIAEPMK
jgi:hypothetical protein